MMAFALTRDELDQLPPVVDLATAGRALGIGRTKAYELARSGEFPCRVLRIGSSYRVPTACRCRDTDGRDLGDRCPKLKRRDGTWNPNHGTWFARKELPPAPDGAWS
jgi:hypothetical protein